MQKRSTFKQPFVDAFIKGILEKLRRDTVKQQNNDAVFSSSAAQPGENTTGYPSRSLTDRYR